MLSFCLYSQDNFEEMQEEQEKTVEIDTEINNYIDYSKLNINQKTINTNQGLFVDFNIVGDYSPSNLGFTAGIFYRFEPIKSDNTLFEGNKLDLGIENIFILNANMTGVYAHFIPTIFMELDVRAYYNATFNIFNYGYIGYNTIPNDAYLSSIESAESFDASGYFVSVAPKFKWRFPSNIEIANTTTITFLSLGDYNYYLNRDNYELYKKSDVEIANEFSMLTHTSFVKVGPSYSILYIISTKTFTQSINLNINLEKYFLNNQLMLYFDLKSGFYLSSTYYPNTAFIKMKLGVQYQIL